jgi:hypothetical protein
LPFITIEKFFLHFSKDPQRDNINLVNFLDKKINHKAQSLLFKLLEIDLTVMDVSLVAMGGEGTKYGEFEIKLFSNFLYSTPLRRIERFHVECGSNPKFQIKIGN